MSKHRHLLLALGVFTAVALVTFRPLFFRWNTLATFRGPVAGMAEADRNLNIWILAWVAHALTTAPGRLFQGNILYPAPDTLAGSEHMLAHVPFTVPVWLLSHNAAYALKAMMLESIVLTALAAYLLVRRQTGDAAAALVAGTALTLSPWRFEPGGVAAGVAAEPQYLGFQFLPLGLLALDVWFERGRWRALVGFAAAMALQALASFYLGYAAFATAPFYAAALVLSRRDGTAWRRGAAVLGAMALAACAVVPAALPYLRLRQRGVVPSYDVDFVASFSAPPWSYVTPGGLALVGPLALILGGAFAVVRLAQWPFRRRPLVASEHAVWTLLAAGLVLGWGPYAVLPGGWHLPLPFWLLWRVVPGFSATRGPTRFVVIVALGLALAAGHALAGVRHRLGRARWAVAAGCIAVAVSWSSWHPVVPEPSGVGPEAAPIYHWLAARPAGEAVLELPTKHGDDDLVGLVRDSRYMLRSTVHWQPILNGYTAYEPPSKALLLALADRLPDARALERLVGLVDLRWVVVHRALLDHAARAAWDRTIPGLVETARLGDDVVYLVTASPRLDRRAEFPARREETPTTLEGTPRVPLPPACREARLEVEAPAAMPPALRKLRVDVRVENAGPCAWPALDVGRTHLVMLEYSWLAGDGDVVGTGEPGRLGGDVPAGGTVSEPLYVYVPPHPGGLRLRVGLRQMGDGPPLAVTEAPVRVTAPPGSS